MDCGVKYWSAILTMYSSVINVESDNEPDHNVGTV